MGSKHSERPVRAGAVAGVMAVAWLIPQIACAQATDLECNRCVDTTDIAANAVNGGKIADGTVGTADLAGQAVTADKIAAGAVLEGKIADGAVSQTKLGQGSVGTNKIIDAAVTRAKIAPDAIGTNKIENGVVTFEKFSLDFQDRFLALEALLPPEAIVVSGGEATVAAAGPGADAAAGALPGRTLLVGGGAAVENCAALRAALASLADSGADNPYLIKLEPGEYDCRGAWGTSPVVMREYVDIEGSGRAVTVIRGDSSTPAAGVVQLAANAELRQVAVVNEAAASAHAVYVPATVQGRVVNVTLTGGGEAEYDHVIACEAEGSAAAADIVVVASVVESGVAAQDAGCASVFVDTQLALVRIARGDRCIASYDRRFAPLDSDCGAPRQGLR